MSAARRPGRALPWLLAGALAVALVYQTGRAMDRLRVSKALRVVEVMSDRMARTGQASRPLVSGHFQILEDARRRDPAEVGVLVALGGQYALLGRAEPAIDAYRAALALEERPEIWLNLGQVHLAAGREEEAREAFAKAVALAPHLRGRVPEALRPERR